MAQSLMMQWHWLWGSEAELKKRTLTNHYNERPARLAVAHTALDLAVRMAYGWDDVDPEEASDEEILGRLLALKKERAGLRGPIGTVDG